MRKVKYYFGSQRRRRGKRSNLPGWMKLWVKFTIADLSGVLLTPIERVLDPPFIKHSDYDLPRSPETEAVYQATLNKLSPGSSE